MTEHLYRDEVGAAVERLAQLEEENARLRGELDRLTAPKKAAARARITAATMVLLAGVLSLAGMGFGGGCPAHRAAKRARFVGSQRTTSAMDPRSRALQPKRDRASCLGFGDPTGAL